MRIIYLSYSKIPSRGANSIQVVKMCAAFAGLGHQPVLFAVKGANQGLSVDEFYGVTQEFQTIQIGVPNIPGLRQFWYTLVVWLRLLRQSRPAVFYGRGAIYSLALASLFKILIILEVHTPPHHFVERWLIRWLCKRNNFYRLVAISKSLEAFYQNLLPELDRKKFLIAQDGADPVFLQDHHPLPSLGREGALQVGYSGHLYEGRGMEVICSLSERLPEVDYHIVGGQEEHIRNWRERCPCSNLYFHGFVNPKEVYSYLDRFDILLVGRQQNVETV